MEQVKHWQDPVNALLGLWVLLSPWALGFQDDRVIMLNAVIVGAALVAVALGAIFVPRAWEEWTEGTLGLWLLVSPWGLGFNTHEQAMLNAVIAGMAIVVLALWTLLTDKDYSGWTRDWTVH